MKRTFTRRRVVGVLATLTVPLAGCSGGGDGAAETTTDATTATDTATATETATATDTATATETATATDTATATETATATDTATATESGGGSRVDEYLSDANEYDGSIADRTGRSEVSVSVGGGDGFAFTPPAIRVDAGTTVVWEWTGGGGLHNVVAEGGAFDSGEAVSGRDVTFEHTFGDSGTYLYYCNPHKALGMKGAVVVA